MRLERFGSLRSCQVDDAFLHCMSTGMFEMYVHKTGVVLQQIAVTGLFMIKVLGCTLYMRRNLQILVKESLDRVY